jgi:transposase
MKLTFEKETKKQLENMATKATKTNNFRLFKIVKSLLLIADGMGLDAIADLFHVTVRTVYNWVEMFMAKRFAWLFGLHHKRRGPKPKINKNQKKKLYDIVIEGPEAYGFDSGVWNSPMIAEVILREFYVVYNPRYLCKLLKKMGLSCQKVAFEPDRTEDNLKKRKEWKEKTWPEILEKAKKKGAVILFGDEVSFAQWGSLSRTWGAIGEQPKIRTKGIRKGLKMFGVIEFFSGSFQYSEADGKFNGESYIGFLKQIMKAYSCPVILVEDGAPYHRSKVVKEYKKEMEKKERLYTYQLPSYSPDFNPIEKLWKNTKRDATHCKFFPTFDDLRKSVVNAFTKYKEDAKKVFCVMTKLRKRASVA